MADFTRSAFPRQCESPFRRQRAAPFAAGTLEDRRRASMSAYGRLRPRALRSQRGQSYVVFGGLGLHRIATGGWRFSAHVRELQAPSVKLIAGRVLLAHFFRRMLLEGGFGWFAMRKLCLFGRGGHRVAALSA